MENIIEAPENTWIEIVRERYLSYMNAMGYENQIVPVTLTKGQKYAKIIVGGSAHSFVERSTGKIFKCAGWSAPAKHARGNVNSPDQGREAFGNSVEYSIRYL